MCNISALYLTHAHVCTCEQTAASLLSISCVFIQCMQFCQDTRNNCLVYLTHAHLCSCEQTAASLLSISATTGGFTDTETIALTENGVASSTFTGSIQVTTNTSNQVCSARMVHSITPGFAYTSSSACQIILTIDICMYVCMIHSIAPSFAYYSSSSTCQIILINYRYVQVAGDNSFFLDLHVSIVN
jgi:hypothetical protein